MRRAALAALVAGVALLLAPAPASAAGAAVPRPGVVILVRQLTWAQLAPLARSTGGSQAAGLVTTLPGGASLAERVLSLAAGQRVDGRAAASGSGGDLVARLRAANPGAAFGGLPAMRVAATPDMAAVALLGVAQQPPPAAVPIPPGPLAPPSGGLLVLGLDDTGQLATVLPRVRTTGGTVLVLGLEASPGRARTAPALLLGGPAGLLTSDSTQWAGLVSFGDLRATLVTVSPGQGAPLEVRATGQPVASVVRLDQQAAALVRARTGAQLLIAAAGALGVLGAAARRRLRAAVRPALLLTLALPAGLLLASIVGPHSAALWLGGGAAVAVLLAAGASVRGLGAPLPLVVVLLGVAAGDLAFGGHGLSRPLVGGSAFDGERFYGIGNGYFADALAAVAVAIGFVPLGRVAAVAAMAALAVVDGLPMLGADVGGALSAMVAAAAAWYFLAPVRPSPRRAVLAGAVAIAAGLAVAFGADRFGRATHAGRFVHSVQAGGTGSALGVFGHKLAINGGLLLHNPWAWFGPLQVVGLGVFLWRRPRFIDHVPEPVLRGAAVGVAGLLASTLLNDTGVTADAGGGLLLLAGVAWAQLWGLDQAAARPGMPDATVGPAGGGRDLPPTGPPTGGAPDAPPTGPASLPDEHPTAR